MVPRSPKQAIFWAIWRSWYPQRPSAAQPPRPNFPKGAPAGRPPLSRRPPLGRPSRAAGAPREVVPTRAPPRSFYCRGGRAASQSHGIMPGKLERIVFSDAAAAIFVKKKTKGTRSTKRHATRGRGGTDNISLWRELIDMIKAKGLAVSAALDLLAASEILSCFELQEEADLDPIRACIEKNVLPSFALVQSICPGELISSVAPALSCLSLGCVLVGANISHLNSAVVTPAAKPPTAAPPTPKPRQSLSHCWRC